MTRRDYVNNSSVALYWDFENLHASLLEDAQGDGAYGKPDGRFKAQEPYIDVQAVIDLASSFGPIAINRAYGNWQWFGRYRDALLQGAVELLQLFSPGPNAKNGADIKLCLDAVEDIGRFDHIRTVVIVGGDSDFMPLAQKIKAAGRTLIGVGTRKSTNRYWARSCHEFRYYENLVAPPPVATEHGRQDSAAASATTAAPADPCADIIRRAIDLLAQSSGDSWVNQASVWPMVKRLDSTFDTKDHGHANFAAMIKAFDALVEMRENPSDQQIRLR